MATSTFGSNATTSLTAIQFGGIGGVGTLPADMATIVNGIFNDLAQAASPPTQLWPGGFSNTGQLFVPNRGVLQCRPGDWVVIEPTTGWPILVSALSVANGPWTHSP